MGVDYYNILKIRRDATEEDVKKSYKRLAMKWHPDKNVVNTELAEAKFKQISEAYDVLSDPQKRQIYNLYGEEGLKTGSFPPNPTSEWKGGYGYQFRPRNAEDIYDEIFGAAGEVEKNQPKEENLPCTLEELYKGFRKKMKVSRTVLDKSGTPGIVEEVLVIDIKPGWKKGTKITFPEKGNHIRGAAPGDLTFVVDEKPHPVFKRDGNDLLLNQKLHLVDALTGKTLRIATLDGRDLAVPVTHIVKPGHEMVIENEGMPISKEPGKFGKLRIKFDVKFPSRLSSEQKAELRRVLSRKSG